MAPTDEARPYDAKSEYEPLVRFQPLTDDEQLAREIVEQAREE